MGQYIRDIGKLYVSNTAEGGRNIYWSEDPVGSEVNTKGRMLQNPTEWWSVECYDQKNTNKFN